MLHHSPSLAELKAGITSKSSPEILKEIRELAALYYKCVGEHIVEFVD